MKIINLPHGTFPVADDATHLHGVPIQTLVDHFFATLDYERFAVGQKAFWISRKTEVTIYRKREDLPGYWSVVTEGGQIKVLHESDLIVMDEPITEAVQ